MPKLFSKHGGSRPPVCSDGATLAVSEELHTLFLTFSSNGLMPASQFCKFLNDVQQEGDVSETYASEIMPTSSDSTADSLFDERQFFHYLFDTDLNFAISNEIHQDMTLPLSHYYIFTGHNSYLTGNQLNSKASEKPIIRALQKGVRVVELDLWPRDNGDIHVVHGRYFEDIDSSSEFGDLPSCNKRKCICEISIPRDYHIGRSSLSRSTSKSSKAQIIRDTIGSQLYYPATQDLSHFPSPEDLKGRILISTKPPKEYSKTVKSEETEFFLGDEEEYFDEEYPDERDCPPEQQKCAAADYKSMIAIRQGRKGKSSSNALRVEEHAKRISLSEPQFSKLAASNPSVLIEFTRENILRIYPRQWRIDSSNYNPMKAWLLGAQMVALNMQGYGKHLWVAQGFFRANGGCGYVKKPKFLLTELMSSLSNYSAKNTTLAVKQVLEVKVCMGLGWRQQLGEDSFDKSSPPDFFTRIGIAGVKADKVMKETAIKKDFWEPSWDDEFVFLLRVPELAVLRIEVLEDNKSGAKFGGQVCLPIIELKSGYRVVNLCDKKGTTWPCVKLLLRIRLSSSSHSSNRRFYGGSWRKTYDRAHLRVFGLP